MNDATTKQTTLTVGLDVGDRYVQVCVLDEAGEVVEESRLPNKRAALERRFAGSERLRIVLEAGTHSPWLARLLEEPSSSPHSILGQPPPSRWHEKASLPGVPLGPQTKDGLAAQFEGGWHVGHYHHDCAEQTDGGVGHRRSVHPGVRP